MNRRRILSLLGALATPDHPDLEAEARRLAHRVLAAHRARPGSDLASHVADRLIEATSTDSDRASTWTIATFLAVMVAAAASTWALTIMKPAMVTDPVGPAWLPLVVPAVLVGLGVSALRA